MARVAIVYKSIHHGNTKKLLDGLVRACEVDLFDAEEARHMNMSGYDAIGFASGIYMSRMHESIYTFLEEQTILPQKAFVIITSGSNNKRYGEAFSYYIKKKGLDIIGIYSCKGFDTYGIFRLIGGIAKHHPNDFDIAAAVSFINETIKNENIDKTKK